MSTRIIGAALLAALERVDEGATGDAVVGAALAELHEVRNALAGVGQASRLQDLLVMLGAEPPRPDNVTVAADESRRGVALAEYAAAKGLQEDFLRGLGLVELGRADGPRVIVMPYHDDGKIIAAKLRIGLEGRDRFRWVTGSDRQFYGLLHLRAARAAGFLFLVEGESDAQTCWLHGLPAVSIPGGVPLVRDARGFALDFPLRLTRDLDGIERIFVVIEPDGAGLMLQWWVAKLPFRDRVRLVHLPTKDLNALHCAHLDDPGAFLDALRAAVAVARPCGDPLAVVSGPGGTIVPVPREGAS